MRSITRGDADDWRLYLLTEARKQLFPLIEQVNSDRVAIEITSRRGNAVLISAEEFAALPDPLDAHTLLDAAARGVTIGLGSDGYVNDFYEVLRGAFLIHKAYRQDPRVMPAAQVFAMATEGGARSLGLEKIGRLAPGWQADLQLVSLDLPTPPEPHNLYDQLVLWRSHAHVNTVWVAGQLRVKGGEVLGADFGALRARTHAAARRLWSL